MKWMMAVLCVVAFAIRTSGQAQEAENVHVVITSDYYAQPKVLVLHALNNSGKDITGYTIIIRHKKADGTLDENGRDGWPGTINCATDLGAPHVGFTCVGF